MKMNKNFVVTFLLMGLLFQPKLSDAAAESKTDTAEKPKITINADGTITLTRDNFDGTKTIDTFDSTTRQILSSEEHNAHGNIKKMIKINTDQTKTITLYFSNETKIRYKINEQGDTFEIAFIDNDILKKTVNDKTLTAWHEAGHAFATIKNHRALINVEYTTIKPKGNSLGHVKQNARYYMKTALDEEINSRIIIFLAGGISEQLCLSSKMFTLAEDILFYFEQESYSSDIQQIHEEIKTNDPKVHDKQIKKLVDQKIIELYPIAYQQMNAKKVEIEKVAHALLANETLKQDDIYELLETKIPLSYNQEGPLRAEDVNDYELRGFGTRPLLYDKKTIDPQRNIEQRLSNGVVIKSQYFMNGDLAIQEQINRDGTQIKTQFIDGKPLNITYYSSSDTPNGHTIFFKYDDNGNKISSTQTMPDKRKIITNFNNQEGFQTIIELDADDAIISTRREPINLEPESKKTKEIKKLQAEERQRQHKKEKEEKFLQAELKQQELE